MPSYDDVRKAANPSIPLGHCISMPIPMLLGDHVVDVFFLHSVDLHTYKPNKPETLLIVDLEGPTVTRKEASKLFGDITFADSEFKYPEQYQKLVSEAKALYGKARLECSCGDIGDSAKKYAALIRSISQDSLMPYYEALAPSLFKSAEQDK